ncbi:hypothetical protein NVP1121O_044 [Vibrio phage 1.121.O._10N.286.46.C4]|nr:hypothetical protein NVP1121O_044 [Vibrio phage 1.121.O._10N.286.46.C4]
MIWEIKAYNGTIWKAPTSMFPEEAIEKFMKDTGMCRLDIKTITNKH